MTAHVTPPSSRDNGYAGGRDSENAIIRGPLRPNKPVAETVPEPPNGPYIDGRPE